MAKRDSFLFTIVAMLVLLLLSYSPNNTNNNHCYRHRHLLLPGSDCILSADYNQHIPDSHADQYSISSPKSMWTPLIGWNFTTRTTTVTFPSRNRSLLVGFKKVLILMITAIGGGKKSISMLPMQMEMVSLTEFNDFLHPADSNNPKLQQWLCKTEVRERDTDRDGKVNFREFFHGLFDLVRSNDKESDNDSDNSDDSVRVLFAQLDKDGDGYLSDIELLPIIGKLHPSWHHYAKQQAEYIISQAEVDKDGRLALTVMVKNPYLFYSAIFNNDRDEYDHSYDEVF